MSQKRRMKASDVFNETTPFLGTTDQLEEGYPGLSDLSATVRELDWDGSEICVRHYSMGAIGRFVDCSNPRCYNGGFNLQAFINVNTYGINGRTDFETVADCQGYEGSPKGRIRHGPCDHRFEVAVHVKYKPSGEAEDCQMS